MWATDLELVGSDTSTTDPTYIAGPGTADTKGSYVELDASTAFTVAWFYVIFGGFDNVSLNLQGLFDIATGAAASETPIVNNMSIGYTGVRSNMGAVEIPLAIASGTRISARIQIDSTSTSSVIALSILLAENSNITGSTAAATYGDDTANSAGTLVDPGGTANTKSTYVEFTASTTVDFNHLVITTDNRGDNTRNASNWMLDVATGAASSEVVLIGDIPMCTAGAHDHLPGCAWSFGSTTIASGTRIALRTQSDDTTASNDIGFVIMTLLPTEPTGGGGGGSSMMIHPGMQGNINA